MKDGIRVRDGIRRRLSAKGIVQKIRSFYSGWLPTLLRDVPFGILYFPLYHHIRMFQAKTTNEKSPDLTNLQACNNIELLELEFLS